MMSYTASSKPMKVLVASHKGKAQLSPLQLVYRDTQLPYFSLYDILGWFMSVAGTTPDSADRENYYKPLLYLYTMWCAKTAGHALMPRTTQITWIQGAAAPRLVQLAPMIPENIDELDESVRVALGATIGAPKPIKDAVLQARYRLLKDHIPDTPPPEVSLVGPRGQLFGHCAETLPFLMLFRSGTAFMHPRPVGGMALSWRAVDKVPEYDAAELQKHIMGPCPNCQLLIEKLNGNMSNFLQT